MTRPIFAVYLLVCLIIAQPVNAQDTEIKDAEIPVESSITGVTVFLRGGQIFRSATVQIPAGRSVLVFQNLDKNLASESVQLSTDAGINVLSVSTKINHLRSPENTEEVERLKRLKEEKADSLEVEEISINVFLLEENMLMQNQSIGSTTSGVELSHLEATADFFRSRLAEIKLNQLRHKKVATRLQKEIAIIDSQLKNLEYQINGSPTAEVVVLVEAASAGKKTFSINYVTPNARWTPVYDFRVADVDSPMDLHYKANIEQRTGETWEDVYLTLSTANPFQNNNKPELGIWRIGYLQPVVNLSRRRASAVSEAQASAKGNAMPEESNSDVFLEESVANLPPPTAVLTTNTTSAEFQIPVPHSVVSFEEPTLVEIATHEIDADYEYYIAPAKRREAFLTMQFTGWEEFNLLSGNANLFFENTFIGRTYLDTEHVGDSLKTSLGVDEGITVSRKRVRDLSSKRMLGGKRTDSFGYEIQIRNNKQAPVTVVIEEQIPVSTDSGIEVSIKDSDGASFEEETGRLSWKKTIQPAETLDLRFSFDVRYAKGRQVDY